MTPPMEPLPSTQTPVRAVLDTDTYNEVDDQFALAYAALSAGIDLEAVYAAPFLNDRSRDPEDGMEKSFEEALQVLSRLGSRRAGSLPKVLKGSRRFLPAREHPVSSEAAEDLVERAMGLPGPLYVLAIAAITNVASAILIEPRILEKIVVVWLGGQPTGWHTASEFNLRQDLPAAQVIFDSGVPLVHIPCKNVAEHLRVTVPELRHWLSGRNALCDYLVSITSDYMDVHASRSKVIWDIATVAWLRNPAWVPSRIVHSPILTAGLTWSQDTSRHFIREAIDVNRDAILDDLYGLLAGRGIGS
jgi:inosine-uridine nucleoside N-ribohydrolase